MQQMKETDFHHGGERYDKSIRLDFSVNTNPLGIPPRVFEELAQNQACFSMYPDQECRLLREKISSAYGQTPESVLCGNGASDLIFRFVHALYPRQVLLLAPTFSEYEKACQSVGATVHFYPLKKEHHYQLDRAFLDNWPDKLDCLFLCNPNNPVGNLIKHDLLYEILQKAKEKKCMVFLDECFLDLTGREEEESCLAYLHQFPNLFILKAFTKRYALAGLRLGFGFCSNQEFLNKMATHGASWAVSGPAQLAGLVCLEEEDYRKKSLEVLACERTFLMEQLKKFPLQLYEPLANYIFFESKKELYQALLEEGILIRSCVNYHTLDAHFYRIAVRTRAENEQLIFALKKVYDV